MVPTLVSLAMFAGRITPPRPLDPSAVEACSHLLWSHAERPDTRAFPPELMNFLLRDYAHAKVLFRIPSRNTKLFRTAILEDQRFVVPRPLVRHRGGVITALAQGTPENLVAMSAVLLERPEFRKHTIEILSGRHRGRPLDLSTDQALIEAQVRSPMDLRRVLHQMPRGSFMIDDALNDESFVVVAKARLDAVPESLTRSLGIRRSKYSLDRVRGMPAAERAWMMAHGERWIFSVPAYDVLRAVEALDRARIPILPEATLSLVDRILMDTGSDDDSVSAAQM